MIKRKPKYFEYGLERKKEWKSMYEGILKS